MSPAAALAGEVSVRMYNVGFGDCFLVTFPTERGTRRVLIDCGSHFMGHGPRPISDVVAQIVADVTGDDGKARIDVVVGTHRHQDHVSGFEDAAWAGVEVGEVWMPWTEHPTDPEARQIRERQSSTASRLKLGLQALGVKADHPALMLAKNALTNAPAMRTLHRGFAGRPKRRFLPRRRRGRSGPRDERALVATPSLPGVNVYVLGPPHDREVIRDMNPPAGESYLWLTTAGADGQAPPPFTPDWEVDPTEFATAYPDLDAGLDAYARKRVKDYAEADPLGLAVRLEAAVNGTSLVLAFEIGEAVLLFPADAQWGTWKAMLEDPDTVDLLERTTFFKIGHHGSHNATPVDFVEKVVLARSEAPRPRDVWAMVSTKPIKIWKEIPKKEVLEAVQTITDRLARSDIVTAPKPAAFSKWDQDVVEARIPIR